MKKIFILLFAAASLKAGAQTGAYNDNVAAYIRQYKAWAIEEQQRTGVPAAITLAQGIHETQAGTSELATEANNHFGIKCKKTWTGETFTHTDDAPDECFRKYAKAYDSYKDHSDYLRQAPRYVHCFEQDVTDYAAWARELKAAGYATNPKYAQKLVRIVEDFHLQDYTYLALKAPQPQGEGLGRLTEPVETRKEPIAEVAREVIPEQDAPVKKETTRTIAAEAKYADEPAAPAVEEYTEPTPVYGQVTMRNNLKGFYAHKGDVLLEQAIKYNMRYAKLLELNDLPDAPLEADMFIYTERKRGMGLRRQHTVRKGETMAQVAQAEGIQVKQLRALNGMADGEEPAADAVLNLQVATSNKPELRIRKESNSTAYQQRPITPVRESETIPTGHAAVNEQADEAEEPAAPKAETIKAVVKEEAPQRKPVEVPTEELAMPVTKPVPAPVAKAEIRRTPPAPPKQKTYTIADEMAVGEEAPKYSPRYRGSDGDNANTTPAAEEQKAAEPAKEEPQDDFSRLKARLDKAVYAPSKPTAAIQSQQQTPVQTAPKQSNTPAPQATDNDSSPAYHYVKTGETAFGIAKQNNLTMKQLRDMNNLNFEAIKVG